MLRARNGRERKKVANRLVAVAVGRDKGSQGALKWAVETLLNRGQTVVLLHMMARSFAFYNRLADTEKSLAVERTRREEALTELEKAKDVAAVAQAEKEEIIRHELKTIEENKILKTDRARLDREVEREKKKVSQLEAEMAKLRGEVENAGSTAIANFKNTDDFQAILMPVFLEGFEHAKTKFSAAVPDFDISKIVPDSGNTIPDEQDKEGGGVEEDVPAEVIAEVTAEVTAQAANVTDEAGSTLNVD